jgi:Ca2+-binding EF-hand superfamily protein
VHRKYDETGDDLLDPVELLRMIRNDLRIMPGDVRDEEVGALVKKLDDDGSGTLSIPELVDFIERGVATFNSGFCHRRCMTRPLLLRQRSL